MGMVSTSIICTAVVALLAFARRNAPWWQEDDPLVYSLHSIDLP
jgi:hypothetical protein